MSKNNNKPNYRSNKPASREENTNRGSQRNSRDRSRMNRAGSVQKGSNDVSWYAVNEQILRDAATLNYSAPIGSRLTMGAHADVNMQNVDSIPGVMALTVTPTIGLSKDRYSAINVAARRNYTVYRYANSGHTNYDAEDLMMYFMAMDSAYMVYSYACRVYGIARTYSQVNRYYPEAVLRSMNMDPKSVIKGLPNLRAAINNFAVQVGAMFVPTGMPIFARHFWMFSGIYTDADSPKSQTYLYTPAGFYKYNATKYETGGCLEWFAWSDRLHTVDDLIDLLGDIMMPILADEDMNIMSGDGLKAYGASKAVALPLISEDYTVTPTIDANVLIQINNAITVGNHAYDRSWRVPVDEDGGVVEFSAQDIIQTPIVGIFQNIMTRNDNPILGNDVFVNLPMLNPTPADTMEATRLCVIAGTTRNPEDDGTYFHSDLISGCDVVNYFKIWSFRETEDHDWAPYPYSFNYTAKGLEYDTTTNEWVSDVVTVANLINGIGLLSKFNYHPRFYPYILMRGEADTNVFNVFESVGDVQTYTVVEPTTLEKINAAAMLSLFAVPAFESVSLRTNGK